ncbi:hypothetical protein E2C01_081235 [Portunus trituberculatus]|uniref:Uncharacterized protein n=1 Tax=Portunus trituberculatus TaxID=210409 RepID=A0A5B7IW33_PORTR|nr:hypothetical protein [Portunus trituberculatus]
MQPSTHHTVIQPLLQTSTGQHPEVQRTINHQRESMRGVPREAFWLYVDNRCLSAPRTAYPPA